MPRILTSIKTFENEGFVFENEGFVFKNGSSGRGILKESQESV
jgi:hypothetical protein